MEKHKALIQKYNRPGPRYTSYPPVPFWENIPEEKIWIDHVRSNYSNEEGLDLYVHVPYCEKLCYYCGCNRTITKNHDLEDPYLKMVLAEWNLYREKLGFTPKVKSLHFGGGTPTFLSPANLETLIKELTRYRAHDFIGSIEIDPRTCSDEHLKILVKQGMKRVSLGIQDFDPAVQSAINRPQSVSMVEALMEKLRKLKFNSINFDLIYGLPKQTLKSISDTMDIVARLKPDLIAFYGYAHLPERIKNQRLIKNEDLPTAEERRELYEKGKEILLGFGYEDIGMDHFALPGSFLHEAKIQGNLHRNFMGYVDKKSSVLIGLGPTSISDSSMSFIQNEKEVDAYMAKVKDRVLPIMNGHTHSSEDLTIQDLILKLMCNDEAKFDCDRLPHWSSIENELSKMKEDGLVSFDGHNIKLTQLGKMFVRNVAMVFDSHLREKTNATRFSQTV